MRTPKIITGRVTGTGWPIDGHVLTLSQWDYDNRESWHLYSWEDQDDEAVMMTMYQTMVEAGFIDADTLDYFKAEWLGGQFEAPGAFTIDLDKVEVLEVLQEAEEIEREYKSPSRFPKIVQLTGNRAQRRRDKHGKKNRK